MIWLGANSVVTEHVPGLVSNFRELVQFASTDSIRAKVKTLVGLTSVVCRDDVIIIDFDVSLGTQYKI